MDIKVESTITLTINGQKYEITRAEAQQIYNALGNVLGNGIVYPPGVRDPNKWPFTSPNTIPCSPQTPVYGNGFDITCESK